MPFFSPLQTALVAMTGLAAAQVVSQLQVAPPQITTTPIYGKTMEMCGDNVKVCGTTAEPVIVHAHNTTSFTTTTATYESVTTLPTQIVVVTEMIVETVANQTQGACQETHTVFNKGPLILTVEQNITTTRSFVPMSTVTTIITTQVVAPVLEQCIVHSTSTGLPIATGTPGGSSGGTPGSASGGTPGGSGTPGSASGGTPGGSSTPGSASPGYGSTGQAPLQNPAGSSNEGEEDEEENYQDASDGSEAESDNEDPYIDQR